MRFAVLEESYTQHGCDQVDGEDLTNRSATAFKALLSSVIVAYIVGISEESNTRNNTSSHMIPPERSFINLSESKSSSLIWILDMGEVIVEVVEGGITTSGLVLGSGSHCSMDI